jgi:hypothetical protein
LKYVERYILNFIYNLLMLLWWSLAWVFPIQFKSSGG